MNDIKLKIEFFKVGETEITNTQIDDHSNNMSGSSFVGNESHMGKTLFELSASDVANGIYLSTKNSYPGIVFNNACDNEGVCDVGFILTGEKINAFALFFDEANNQYASKLSVNGVEYLNHKTRFCVVGLNEQTEVVVRILKWSKPLMHVKITSLSLSLTEEFDKRFIKSVERNSALLDDNKKPDYGISAQSGKIVLQDRDNIILDLSRQKVLKDGLNFELILNGRTIGKYLSNNLTYTSLDNTASVDLIDDITNLQEQIFIGIDFPTVPSEVVPLTALEILTAFYPKVFQMDSETRTHLNLIVVAFPKMERKDVYKSLIDFCKATSCRVYKDQKGELNIKHIK